MDKNKLSTLDVFIKDSSIDRVKLFAEHVKKLFFVELKFTSAKGKQFMHMAGVWLEIQGQEYENVVKAREYVKGLSSPEEVVRISFPPPVYYLLCGTNGEKLSNLEKETTANIAFNSLEEVEISGSISSVTKASCFVEEIVKKFIDEKISETDTDDSASSIGRDSGIYIKCNSGSDCFHDENSDISYGTRSSILTVDEDLSDDISLSRDSLLDREELNRSLSEKGFNDIIDSDLMEYARKLGYSDSQVKSAMKKLGPDTVDQNELLHELIKAANSQRDGISFENSSDLSTFYESVTTPSNTGTAFLRHVVVDGSNVAMSHGNNQVFSCRGIAIVVNWFQKRGHAVTVFVPNWRNESSKQNTPIIDQEILTKLSDDGVLSFTPSRRVGGKLIQCYDDRYIVRLAVETDGIIVSNDHFRDIQRDMHEWKDFINKRLLMYTFAGDIFMPPDDPLGRHGPTLNEFLKKSVEKKGIQFCPYGKKCTFGPKCKFYHPERRFTGSFMKKPLPPLPNQPQETNSGSRPRSDPGQSFSAALDGKQRPISLPNLEQLYVSPPHSLHRFIYVQNNDFSRPISGPPFQGNINISQNINAIYNINNEISFSMEHSHKQKFSGDHFTPQYLLVPPHCRGELGSNKTNSNIQTNCDYVGRPLSSDFSSRPSSGEYSYSSESRPHSGEYGSNSRLSSEDFSPMQQWSMGLYQRQYNHGNFYPMKNYYRNTPTLPETQEETRHAPGSLKIEIVEQLRELFPDQYDKILWVLRTYPEIKNIDDAIPIMKECLNT
ncbi:uncharacterized protein LOC100198679 isoform X1 [Hydra vulgaris]|uniref:Probable ribonuclease ZC3H12C n=1 Tax=Hydra vulgaris TaxID=6087 RepID=T2M6F1_HYDVU|nr:uncharacterized protein LOC100198679 isoform X1 [Hydra vulgaris]